MDPRTKTRTDLRFEAAEAQADVLFLVACLGLLAVAVMISMAVLA
jgi:hypothetical protein